VGQKGEVLGRLRATTALVIVTSYNMALAPTKGSSGATDVGSRPEARESSTLNKYDERSVSTCNLREHDNIRLTSHPYRYFICKRRIPAVKIGTVSRDVAENFDRLFGKSTNNIRQILE